MNFKAFNFPEKKKDFERKNYHRYYILYLSQERCKIEEKKT